jgi:PIN domain nuclease of toxin-antitoxin system
MRLLLETHIFLWVVSDGSRLTAEVRRILDGATAVYVSSASIWEIAIKTQLGKLRVDPDKMMNAIEESGFQELPVLSRHAVGVAKLPLHHGDPFDRLLVAQAISEPMRLVTSDVQLTVYSELVIKV